MTQVLPHDIHAEQALLGTCLVYGHAVKAALEHLLPSDFYRPAHGAVFQAMADLHAEGSAIDTGTVWDQLRRSGATTGLVINDLTAWMTDAPSAGSVPRYAQIIGSYSLRRRLIVEATELTRQAQDLTQDPADTVQSHTARLAAIDSPILARSPGDMDIDEFIRGHDAQASVVVPGLLNADDRVIFVAPEGTAKSTLQRVFTVGVAHGIHPFDFSLIAPQPTLLADFENPSRVVRSWLRLLTELAERHTSPTTPSARARAVLWHKPAGIDLRKRSDRVAFEDVLRRNRPKLVCLGPLYKAYIRKGNETDEQVASEVQAVLDDLRVRYGFALVLEHHAPQIESGGHRELRPFGSSLWLRWPEFGLKLIPDLERPHDVLKVGRWRGDRSEANWPDELHRSQPWPWVGRWHQAPPNPHQGAQGDPAF